MSSTASAGPRTWFITGCSSGFGRAIAEAALQAGDRVVLTARDVSSIESLAAVVPEQALALACDALGTDPAQADVLRAADAITVRVDASRVARVIPGDADSIVATQRVLAAIAQLPEHILQPLGEAVVLGDTLVVPYPLVVPGAPADADLGIAGACLAALHSRASPAG